MSIDVLAPASDLIKPSPIREVVAMIDQARQKGLEIANFSIGRPDFDTPAHIKEAAIQALREGKVHYAHTAGLMELREAVCARMRQDFGLEYTTEEVIITVGASEAIYIATQTILQSGDETLAPFPAFVYYQGWSALGGAELKGISLEAKDDFQLKAIQVERQITPRTKILIINSPHNPTGQVFERAELRKIANLAKQHDFWVIADDIYNYTLYDRADYVSIASLPGMKERSLVIGSFSKTYAMDGWRIGFLLAPREFTARAVKVHQHAVSCCNTFAQFGAAAALIGSQDCVHEMVAEFDRRRRLLMERLDEIGLKYVKPQGAFYVFPSIREFGLSSMEMSRLLLEKAGVAVVPGSAFGPEGEGFIRMAYSTSYEQIQKGMDRMGELLGSL